MIFKIRQLSSEAGNMCSTSIIIGNIACFFINNIGNKSTQQLKSYLRQGTHLADSALFSDIFSRFSINCWTFWASNIYLAGPIGPANDPCSGRIISIQG